ncbi:MAG: sodium:alanine symporter family protein [Ruminococcus sp.]|nr:sodium:alanine symporter family protein [Ruminococcus sp.]
METFNKITEKIDNIVWGIPLILLILGCGIFLTIRVGGIQFRKLGLALKYMFKDEKDGSGEISSFAALCTALSATIGTGNIVGVATAIAAGGPGALFWMEIAALFGMATKYAEGLLAVKYRVKSADGKILGGPFYYIENGLGKKWKWLAAVFAAFGVVVGLLGIGTFAQVNSITSAANQFFDPKKAHTIELFGTNYTYTQIITGLIITILAGLIIIGGIKRIASVSEVVIPLMVVIYVSCCLIIIFTHITDVPAAFAEIFKSAFGLKAAAGGALGAIMVSMQKGIARGIFSNEAGLGSAPIAAAAAKTKEPVRQGLVTMTGTFIDTIIVCTMTGLTIVISGCIDSNPDLEGVEITDAAFRYGLPFPEKLSSFLLMTCLMFFAFTTILGWNYYSERCLSYLTNSSKKASAIFKWLYITAVFIGPYLAVSAVWNIADIFNGLMALPNVIALLALSGVISSETKKYCNKIKSKKGVN